MSVAPITVLGQNFGRVWNLVITSFKGTQITIAGGINQETIQFTFAINKNIQRSFQLSEITIFNLDPDTETEILENGYTATLDVGYQNGNNGNIFTGNIRQSIRNKPDPTTTQIKLIVIDGLNALNLSFCSFTLAEGQTMQTIAKQIRQSSSIPFELAIDPNLSQEQLSTRGVTVMGKPADALRNLAISNNAAMNVQNGVVNLTSLNSAPPSGNIISVNALSGMIGQPTQTPKGVNVRILINAHITLGSWIKLNNQDIVVNQLNFGVPQTTLDLDGLYRVIGINAIGDTRGNDWYYDLMTISQTGPLPAALGANTDSLQ